MMNPKESQNSLQGEERIRAILQPLLRENASADYLYHFKSMLDFDNCLGKVETLYAQAYAQVVTVEKDIAHYRNIS